MEKIKVINLLITFLISLVVLMALTTTGLSMMNEPSTLYVIFGGALTIIGVGQFAAIVIGLLIKLNKLNKEGSE